MLITFISSALLVDRFLGKKIDFSLQPSAVIKIKDGGHNFRYEITEHSLAKITPALQARKKVLFLKNEDSVGCYGL